MKIVITINDPAELRSAKTTKKILELAANNLPQGSYTVHLKDYGKPDPDPAQCDTSKKDQTRTPDTFYALQESRKHSYITKDIKTRFLDLANQLSPENLSCDGELNKTQVRARFRKIKTEWANLERRIGMEVTEDMAWTWDTTN